MTDGVTDTLDDNRTAVAQLDDGTRLLRNRDAGGVVRHADGAERAFGRWPDARLYFGLWAATGGWSARPDDAVPIPVVAAGKPAVTAYLRVGRAGVADVDTVADELDIEREAVNNNCYRIRYNGNE